MTESVVDIVHQNIHQRQSIGSLVAPAPNAEQLEYAFQAALTAPDHHRLKPTSFVVVPDEQREAFGLLLSQALIDLGETETAQIERVKNHPFRAPLLVLALTRLQDHPKVPHFEQILSSGAAIQNFLLSLQAQGFSTMWRSGVVVESTLFKQALGISKDDLISGIIYIGTAAKTIASRADIQTSNYVSYWHPNN
ncbi:nitroreductase family protein [Acinetobacter bohemicus]|uniref:nitroreductase family protein n=1 Tax=Acinetobacter TaxID=469 RepID=UPI001167A53E|nr:MULTISPECIES: nitroreductase family protein [Acinetobacter]MDM1781745.1 nitroreductase family protein [Acinetobacter indicus]MCO8042047.1 nitroreductase family protein [Acinetobacter sp. S4400-12]MCU7224141.1 nitroreductase family protein [Acinetobacter bohemicus]QKQ70216.1 nitroreductase [Acinetobacter sp. 10FS3-1]TQR66353.1 nitroreductase [Acinetobacter sp. RF14B]